MHVLTSLVKEAMQYKSALLGSFPVGYCPAWENVAGVLQFSIRLPVLICVQIYVHL